jgi:hypothetical protein
MKKSKPYFSQIVEDKIVSIINEELSKESKKCDEPAIRRYVQSGKNTYENAILHGVSEGQYLATIVKNEFAYKPKPPTDQEITDIYSLAQHAVIKAKEADPTTEAQAPNVKQIELAIKQARASKLSHALNMVAIHGNGTKLGVEAEAIVPITQESK